MKQNRKSISEHQTVIQESWSDTLVAKRFLEIIAKKFEHHKETKDQVNRMAKIMAYICLAIGMF